MNKRQKDFVKTYLILVALGFLIFNWNNVSWLFNYRVMSSLTYDFFNPYQESELLVSASNTSSVLPPVNTIAVAPTQIFPYVQKDNSIEIGKIKVEAPIVIGQTTDPTILVKDLDRGVAIYPGSVVPGQNGQTVILGHSAPPGWPKIKYDWVFSEINSLESGDQVVLNFNNRQYVYRVTTKKIVNIGEELPIDGSRGNTLTLVSCWPPGKNYKRIAVNAQLITSLAYNETYN